MEKFMPIKPNTNEQVNTVHESRKYVTPDFMATVIAMREKLLELQKASKGDEPTENKNIRKDWKDKIALAYGNVNDLRAYEKIAVLSNENFSKVLEIAANADRCTRNGTVTQYTFKSVKKNMTEVAVSETLCEILNGDAKTVTALNNASKIGSTSNKDSKQGEAPDSEVASDSNKWKNMFEKERRKSDNLKKQVVELQENLEKTKTERDRYKGKTQELLVRVREMEQLVDEIETRSHEQLSQKSMNITKLNAELSSSKETIADLMLRDDDKEMGVSTPIKYTKGEKRKHSSKTSVKRGKTEGTSTDTVIRKTTEIKMSTGSILLMSDIDARDIVPESPPNELEPQKTAISLPRQEECEDEALQYFAKQIKLDLDREDLVPLGIEGQTLDEFANSFCSEDDEDPRPLATSTPVKANMELTEGVDNVYDIDNAVNVEATDEVRQDVDSREEESADQYVAVAYSNCDRFYLGQLLSSNEGVLSIRFLIEDGKTASYIWPPQPVEEKVDRDQVFMCGLRVTEKKGKLTFQEIAEIRHKFPFCWERLKRKQKVAQIDAIWSDLSCPFRSFSEGVVWKDIKTLQKDMPAEHEAEMLSHFSKDTIWEKGWLNDKVINAYMVALERRANRSGKKIITGNSFFFEIAKKNKSWRSKLNLSRYKKILFPGQLGQKNHWVLGVVDLENHTITQIDPIGKSTPGFYNVIRDYLQKRKGMKDRPWTQLDISHPIQSDGVSCGVYVLKIAECIIEGDEIAFDQNDIDNFRYDIAYRLTNAGKW